VLGRYGWYAPNFKEAGDFKAAGAGYFKVEFQNLMPLFDICELPKYKYLLRPPLSENYHS
jgi:hypothetical protein